MAECKIKVNTEKLKREWAWLDTDDLLFTLKRNIDYVLENRYGKESSENYLKGIKAFIECLESEE